MRLRLAFAVVATLAAVLTTGCGSGSDSPEPAEPVAAEWSYEGESGPDHWDELDSEYELCEMGHRQSPVNLTGARRASFPRVVTRYFPEHLKIEDNGHAVEAVIEDPRSSISIAGTEYKLEQFHFHMPSEERIDGRGFPATIHLVHISEEGRIAVVAVLVRPGAANPAFDFDVPREPGKATELEEKFNPAELLPESDLGYRYQGSLTTPPCTEGVTWTVMRQPISMSLGQLREIGESHYGNARPTEPIEGRRILVGPALAPTRD